MRPDRSDFKPERPDLRPERPDLRPERLGGGGRMNEPTKEQMNRRTKVPPVFYRTSSPSGPLPKNPKKVKCDGPTDQRMD